MILLLHEFLLGWISQKKFFVGYSGGLSPSQDGSLDGISITGIATGAPAPATASSIPSASPVQCPSPAQPASTAPAHPQRLEPRVVQTATPPPPPPLPTPQLFPVASTTPAPVVVKTASEIAASSSGRNRKKSKQKCPPKPRTIKFHEYKGPPNAQKQQQATPSDVETSYELLLQQQQLFLQWQLEWQHKYPQIILPAKPNSSSNSSPANGTDAVGNLATFLAASASGHPSKLLSI